MFLCLTTVSSQGGGISISCNPRVVGSQSATLVLQFFTEQNIRQGGKIQIIVPKQASIVDGNHECYLQSFFEKDGILCTADSKKNTLTLELDFELPAFTPSEIRFKYAFNVPLSTAPTDSFIVNFYDKNEETIETYKGGIFIQDLEIASIQAATITQVNNSRVGKLTQAYFSVTTLNPIPAGGGLQIRFPKWNSMAPAALRDSFVVLPEEYDAALLSNQNKRLLQSDQKLCSPKLGVSSNSRCVLHTTNNYDYLTLIYAFPNGQPAGQTFAFYVSYLRNPISLSPVEFTIQTNTGIQEQTNDDILFKGLIDEGKAVMVAEDGAIMDPQFSQISADVTTVQEYSVFYVPFSAPVPIQKGCIVLIQLPEDFTLVEGNISNVQGWGIFGGKSTLTAELDTLSRTIKIVDQCVNYSSANLQSTVQIQSLRNPNYVLETKTFSISILDSNSNLIASINSQITYKPTNGTVKDINLVSLAGVEIQTISDILLTFTPTHALSGDSFFMLKLPSNIEFSCNLAYTQNLKTAPTCIKLSSNELQFNSTFIDDSYQGNQPLTIAFKNRVLPGSKQPVKGISINTYQVNNGRSYLVDSYVNREMLFFETQSTLFFSATVKSSSEITYSNTGLTFDVTLANDVPVGSLIRIQFPREIRLANLFVVQKFCKALSGLQSIIACQFAQNKVSYIDEQGNQNSAEVVVLTARNAFAAVGMKQQDDFQIQISTGVITPTSVKTSGTFIIQVLDKEEREINFVKSALTLTMKQGIDIGPLELVSDSYLVGALTNHTLSFTTPVPLIDGTRIYILIPEEIGTPNSGKFTVSSVLPIGQNFTSSIIGNKITILVAVDPSVENGEIKNDSKISFTFGPLKNPQSMAPSSPYKVRIESSDGYEEADQVTTGVKMRNQVGAKIKDYSFTAFDQRQGSLTTITITWVNTQVYPQDLSLIIKFDPTQIYPKLPEGSRTAPCLFRNSRFVECQFFDDYIKVNKIIASPEQAGQTLSLTITNMYFNVFEPLETNSWTMKTYTQDSVFEIDEIDGPMKFRFDCNYPCLSCNAPSECKSCNDFDIGGYLILYEGKCYADCPDGTYEESFQCKPCNPKCKTCSKTNPQFCTSCNPESEFPFLDGNTCTQQCSFGKYGNFQTAKCELCAKPCQSCSGDAESCLTCDQTAIEKYFHQNQCLRQCPFNFVADVTTRSTVCEPCSLNCYGCFGTKDICSSCPPNQLLNLYQNANNCVSQCPLDVSVENRKGSQPICEPCDDKCLTCKETAKFCTSCRQNFNLKEELGVCSLECDTLANKQVPLDGQCVACDPVCKTCQGTKDNCLTCWPGTHWYNKTCVQQCPVIEGYQYEPDDNNRCVIPGLRCKFGYKVSETGNFCQLVLSVCPPPTLINFDKDKCIPGSDRWVPFPIWILWIAPTLLVLSISKLKARETNFVQNWIVLLGIAEIAAMFFIVYLARDFGITPVTAMIGFTIIIHYGINFFFLLVFTKQVKNDTALTHWCQYNRKITTTITVIGTLLNFKSYRLFFSRFFGREEFNAPMESPIIFYAPFNLSSLLNLVLVKLVVLFACVFGLYYVRWGYQLLIECLELLFIEILIMVLYVIEYFQMRQTLLKQKQYQQIDPKKVDAGKVLGFVEFSSDEDSQEIIDPKIKERRGKPKAIKTIHQMEKILLEFDHKEIRKNYGRHEYIEDDPKEREIMRRHRRHCISFRGLPTTMPDAWLSDNSDEGQNFISEPNSPRSKQMLHNSQFITRMHILREALRERDQSNNCYAQSVDFSKKPMRNIKLVSVKVQTNVMELLGLDDLLLAPQVEPESEVSDQSSRYIEELYEETATAKLIENVIMKIDSDQDVDDKAQRDLLNKKFAKDNTKGRRKKRKLTKKRIAEIPNYDPEEILGEFTRDEKGFNLMVRSRNGKLNDKFGRMINRRGYLVDQAGNIVTRGGVFIFHVDELTDDDEIPAPYCLSRPQMLFRVIDYDEYKKQQKQHRLNMQDQYIEREYQRLKAESVAKAKSVLVKPSSQVNRSTKFDRQSDKTQSGKSGHQMQDEESLSQIIEPIKPKTKAQLLAKSSSSSLAAKAKIKSDYERKSSGSRVFSGQTKRGISRGSQGSIESRQRKSSEKDSRQRKSSKSGKYGKGSTVDDPYLTGAEMSNQLNQMQSEYEFQNVSSKERDNVTGFQNDQDLVGLKFDEVDLNQHQKPKPKRNKSNKRQQSPKRKSSPHSRTRSINDYENDVYLKNQRKMEANQQAIRQDEHFIAKMNKFNKFVNEKKLKYIQQLNYASGSSIQMDDRYLHEDGSVKSMGLRHQNLGQIYGRVRQRFNKQIRQGGAALKFGFADSRNLMPHVTDDVNPDNILQLDLESGLVQRKSSYGGKRANKISDSAKLQELQQIYSNARPDLNSAQREKSIMNQSLGQRSEIFAQKLPMAKFGPKSTAVIQPILFHDLSIPASDQSQTLARATDEVDRQMQQMRKNLREKNVSSFDNSAHSKPRHHEAKSAAENAGAYDLLHGKYI